MSRSACLALVLAAFLLGGCGGGSTTVQQPTPLSRAAFVRKANHICAVGNRRAHHLKKATNHKELMRVLRAAVRLFEGEMDDFRRLTPPRADAASFARLIADMEKEDFDAHLLIDAAADEHVGRVKAIDRKLKAFDKKLKSISKALGLRDCAKD